MRNQIAEIEVSYSSIVKKADRIKISHSKDVHRVILELWDLNLMELQEQFRILLLNNANEIIGSHNISKGNINSTVVDVKLIFAIALKCNAKSIIIAHNHPSGNLAPSKIDIVLTKKLKEAGQLLDINLLDHIIITKEDYYSFTDKGNVL